MAAPGTVHPSAPAGRPGPRARVVDITLVNDAAPPSAVLCAIAGPIAALDAARPPEPLQPTYARVVIYPRAVVAIDGGPEPATVRGYYDPSRGAFVLSSTALRAPDVGARFGRWAVFLAHEARRGWPGAGGRAPTGGAPTGGAPAARRRTTSVPTDPAYTVRVRRVHVWRAWLRDRLSPT